MREERGKGEGSLERGSDICIQPHVFKHTEHSSSLFRLSMKIKVFL